MEKLMILSTLLCAFVVVNAQKAPAVNLSDLINKVFNTTDNSNNPNVFNPVPNGNNNINNNNNNNDNINSNNNNQVEKYKSCGHQKECVPRFLCKNDEISTDGIGIIDIRIDGAECNYLEVCCDIPNKTNEPIINPVPPEVHDGCGYQNPDGVGFRITGDKSNEAQFGEFPWMCAVLREERAADEILNLYECGGALIAPTTVITAAHCVQNRVANTLVVRAGEWDTQYQTELLAHQDRRVKEIIVHELYNKGSLFNDIAVLILEEPFSYAENIRPICLPESNVNFDHSRCFATGWGKDTFGKEGEYQVILKKIDLPVMPRNQCQTNLRTTRLGKYFQLHESFICAGGERDKDTCKGDGGSPLVCPIPGAKNRFYQAGIVAWGIGCGEENIPGVYASIPFLRQWINDKLSSRGIDFSHFSIK